MLEFLKNQPRLPEDILLSMAEWLEDQDEVRRHSSSSYRGHTCRIGAPFDNVLQVVVLRLKNQDRIIRKKALRALQYEHQRGLPLASPDDLYQLIVTWLEDEDSDTIQIMLETLSNEFAFSEGIIKAVVTRLKDKDQNLRRMATQVLQHQQVLSDDFLQVMVTWLQGRDGVAKQMALQALCRNPALPQGVLEAIVPQFED